MIFGILALIGVAGVLITIFEHRKGRVLLARDLRKDTANRVQARDHAMTLTVHPRRGPHIF